MATHSSFLAWKIPWTEEAGRLQSMGWQRVRHDWATSLTHCRHMPQVSVFVIFFLEMSLFCLHFWSVFFLKNLIFFFFKHFRDSFYCLLVSAVCDGKSNVICIVCSPISHVSIFLWLLLRFALYILLLSVWP